MKRGKGVLKQIIKDPVSGETKIFYNVESDYKSLILNSIMGEVTRLAERSKTLKSAMDSLSLRQQAEACWDAIRQDTALSALRLFMMVRKAENLPGEEVIKRLTPEVLGFDIDPKVAAKIAAERMRYYYAKGIGLKDS